MAAVAIMAEAEQFSALVARIYDAAIDPAGWDSALAAIRSQFRGATTGIVTKDATTNRGGVFHDDGGIAGEFSTSYFDRYMMLDPCTTGHVFSSPENPVTTTDLIDRDTFLGTRFYKEWARPQGLNDYIATAIDRSATTATVFNVTRRASEGLFDDESREMMRMLAPHVRRATLVGRTLAQAAAKASAMVETMDSLSAGLFLVDNGGHLVHANAAGRQILESGRVLKERDRRLVAVEARADAALRDVYEASGEGDASLGVKGVAMPLTDAEGDHHVAHVLPLSGGERRSAGVFHEAAAAIFVRKAEINVSSPPEALVRQYRLTPTELRILLAICEIGGVPEVADAFGIAETTVKTHLGRVYAKTGTARQADLVKLVAGFSSPLLA